MIDVVDAVRELLEPTDPTDENVSVNGVNIDRTAAQPFEPQANTIYAWEAARAHRSVGTGEVQEDFAVDVLYVIDNEGETAQATRIREVSEALDTKTTTYLDLVREFANIPPWASGNIQASSDADFVRQFDVRGVAVHVTGYRLLS